MDSRSRREANAAAANSLEAAARRPCGTEALAAREGKKCLGAPMCWPAASLLSLPDDALATTLSFTLCPESMAAICALNRRLSGSAWTTQAWERVGVDTAKLRPAGSLARRHFTLWSACAFVVAGEWQQASLALLMSPRFATWCWSGRPLQHVSGRWLQVSQSTVPRKVIVRVGEHVPSCTVAFGIASSRCPQEIIAAHEVGPTPLSEQHVDFCCAVLSSFGATFCWNGTQLGSAPRSLLRPLQTICFAYTNGGLRLICGEALDAECPHGARRLENNYLFAVAVFEQIERPCRNMLQACWTLGW